MQNEDFFPYTSEKEMFLTCTLQIEYPIDSKKMLNMSSKARLQKRLSTTAK